MRQAMDSTMKLSCFVLFILIGSTVFSLSFQAVDGPIWVEHLLTSLPGGQLGFLIVVNILIFFLAFFLDFFELSFIVIPLIGPVADKLGIDLVWFGVLLAINMQTSFMHPPFGFALFYLRSVAPTEDYDDRVTEKRVGKVTTGQIYWGAVPFVIIQVIMVGLVIAFPGLVSSGARQGTDSRRRQGLPADAARVRIQVRRPRSRPCRARPRPGGVRRRPGCRPGSVRCRRNEEPARRLQEGRRQEALRCCAGNPRVSLRRRSARPIGTTRRCGSTCQEKAPPLRGFS